MLIDNDLTLKEGDKESVSLKCKAKVSLSDDFEYKYHTVEKKGSLEENTLTTYEHYNELGGSIAVSLYDITLSVKDAVLTGSIDVSADFDKMEGSLELSLSEKIGDKDIAALELALDVKNAEELTEGSIIEYLINNVKIYKFEIEGKSYSAESVRTFIKTALGMSSSDSEA